MLPIPNFKVEKDASLPEILDPELGEGLMRGLEGSINAGWCEGLLNRRLYLQIYLGGAVALTTGDPFLRHPDLGDAGPVGPATLHVADEGGQVPELLHGRREGLHLRPFWDGGGYRNFEAFWSQFGSENEEDRG